MIKNECSIVRDLLAGYIEEEVNLSTKEFIENHIRSCDNCKKILDELKEENIKENKEDAEDIEIDYLKKYNKKINTLKGIAIFIVLIVVIIWGAIFVKHLKNKEHYEYLHNILNSAYEKTISLKETEKNFFLITTDSSNNEEKLYYKDGKFKLISKVNFEDGRKIEEYTNYGVETGNNSIAYIQLHKINGEYEKNGSTAVRSNNDYNETNPALKIYLLKYYCDMDIMQSLSLNIREDKYKEKDVYVIRNMKNNEEYSELWIDKESKLVIKLIDNTNENKYEKNYLWQVGNVTSEDVTIENKEKKNEIFYDEILELLIK